MKPQEIPSFVAPVLCRHKSGKRDRAYFRHDGKFHWCGKWGTPQAAENYARKVAELSAHGGIALPALDGPDVLTLPSLSPSPYRVAPCAAWDAQGLHAAAWAAWVGRHSPPKKRTSQRPFF